MSLSLLENVNKPFSAHRLLLLRHAETNPVVGSNFSLVYLGNSRRMVSCAKSSDSYHLVVHPKKKEKLKKNVQVFFPIFNYFSVSAYDFMWVWRFLIYLVTFCDF